MLVSKRSRLKSSEEMNLQARGEQASKERRFTSSKFLSGLPVEGVVQIKDVCLTSLRSWLEVNLSASNYAKKFPSLLCPLFLTFSEFHMSSCWQPRLTSHPLQKQKHKVKEEEISARECTSVLKSLTSVCKSPHHRIISQLVGWLVSWRS